MTDVRPFPAYATVSCDETPCEALQTPKTRVRAVCVSSVPVAWLGTELAWRERVFGFQRTRYVLKIEALDGARDCIA